MKKPVKRNHEKSIAATEPSVQSQILEALADFTDALEKGEILKRYTCRHVRLNLVATHYTPELVKKTRSLLGVSQTLFGRFLGVSPKTVRSWEQGINPPHPMACRFMDEIRTDPKHWIERIREVTVTQREMKNAQRPSPGVLL